MQSLRKLLDDLEIPGQNIEGDKNNLILLTNI